MITTTKGPRAIIFFGPDGSGKTTQANLLIGEMRRRGIKTRRLWLRSLHTLAFVISGLAMRLQKLNNPYEFRQRYAHRKLFRTVWFMIEFISILPLVVLRFYIPLRRGENIVAERYVIDWIVSLAYVSRNDSLVDTHFAKVALKFIPKDSILIYIDATFDAISSRGRKEDSLEFIEFQRAIYARIAESHNALVIDTSDKSIQEVHERIIAYALER